MNDIRHIIGIDISTQTISAILIGVKERESAASELVISSAWIASRPCRDEIDRRSPETWVRLVRECVEDLKKQARETRLVQAIGVGTTFPGTFPIMNDGSIDPHYVSLYDNRDDAGICEGGCENVLAAAESETLNRMWPGNMAVGLAHLVRTCGLDLDKVAALVPGNTAFTHALLRASGYSGAPDLFTDFTQAVIGGMYHARTFERVPRGVEDLMNVILPGLSVERLRELLPRVELSWRNVIPEPAMEGVRALLGLPNLKSVSIGVGDSPLGALALFPGDDGVLNVRGSSDSPMIVVSSPRPRTTARETVLHYPMPTIASPGDGPWCAVAPMLRSGKVWDWVRRLGFDESDANADAELETLAVEALKRRLRAPVGSIERQPLRFNTSLGGERAPDWDPRGTGEIKGLVESHAIGDIALAALEGMSRTLRECLLQMESRYEVKPSRLVLAGGPVRNRLWNWLTQLITGKKTFATTFSDASLLGAAMLGYGASYNGAEDDATISARLKSLSELALRHPLISPVPVEAPDEELAAMEYVC